MPFKQVFSGRIATEPWLAHPQAAYELLAKTEVVNGQPAFSDKTGESVDLMPQARSKNARSTLCCWKWRWLSRFIIVSFHMQPN